MSAPRGGDVLEALRPYTIQWTPGSPGPVKIWLAIGDNNPIAITGKSEPFCMSLYLVAVFCK